jgi:hypothetical protein
VKHRRIGFLVLSLVLCLAALVALLVSLGATARAQATARFVAVGGTDNGACTDPENPCRTVQYAVDVAGAGDAIKVAAGVYTDVHTRPVPAGYISLPETSVITQVVYISKTVSLQGGYTTTNSFADPPDPEAYPTTLDARRQGRVLFASGKISPTIEGLRLTGGDATGQGGDPWHGSAGMVREQ